MLFMPHAHISGDVIKHGLSTKQSIWMETTSIFDGVTGQPQICPSSFLLFRWYTICSPRYCLHTIFDVLQSTSWPVMYERARSPQVRTRGPRGVEPKEQEREGPNGRVREAGTRVQVGTSHDEDLVSESKLYPVEEFMQTFVRQEAVMWQKRGLLSIAESTSVLGSADNVSAISRPSSRALSLAGGEEEDNLTMG